VREVMKIATRPRGQHRHVLCGSRPRCGTGEVISSWGFTVTPEVLTQMAKDVGETTILSRTGGAPTLAVGMATILSELFGARSLMGLWYHFAILFEALFILTTVDAGTRALRFMIQDLAGNVVPSFKQTKSWANNLIGSGLAVALRHLHTVAAVRHS
jgi:carbon starvation protein CstA